MESVRIPEYVDSFPQILFWEADEIAPAMILLIVGIITETLTMLWIPMWIITKLFMKSKENNLDGYLHHVVYDLGLLALNRRYKNGLIRERHE